MSRKGKIVGHKTFDDGHGGYRHEPLYEDEATVIMAAVKKAKADRHADIPDQATALRVMMDAWTRLKEMGWREAQYAPTDRSRLELIEVGSTGVHRGYRDEQRRFWVIDGDTWPSSPVLWRPLAPRPAGEDHPAP